MNGIDILGRGGEMYRRLALPILVLVPSMVVAGYSPETADNLLLGDLEALPIIITPSRMVQPINETATATTIIDRKFILASGIRDLPELFRLVPGMIVNYESGHKANVKYHGLDDSGNARHLQVLIDGRSVYQPAFSRVIWSDLPIAIEDIERIEVVRGASSTIHGSNAFLGVINIITQNPADTHGTTLRMSSGVDGVNDGFVRISDSLGDLNYRLSMKHQSDDGFDHDSSGDPRYDRQKGNFLNLQAEIPLSDQDTLTIDLGHKRGDKEEPAPTLNGIVITTSPSQLEQWSFNSEHLRWVHHLNPDHKLQLQFFHHLSTVESINRYTEYYRNKYLVDTYDQSYEEERFDLEIEDTLVLNNSLRLGSGGSLRRDYLTSKLYTANRKAKKDTFRLFGNLEWRPVEDTVIQAGVMWEREKVSGGEVGSHLSPRAAINYHIDDHHTIRASYSEAISSPDLLATNNITTLKQGNYMPPLLLRIGTNHLNEILGLSNTTLKPEHITSREIGWITHIPEQRLDLDIKLFSEKMRDLFGDTGADDGVYGSVDVVINQNHANISGIEAQIKWHPYPANTLLLSGSHLFHFNSNDWKTADSFPTNSGTLMNIHDFSGGITASAALYYSGEMIGTDGVIGGPFRRVDARVSRELKMGDGVSAELSLVLQHRLDDNPENSQENFYNDKNKGWLQLGLRF